MGGEDAPPFRGSQNERTSQVCRWYTQGMRLILGLLVLLVLVWQGIAPAVSFGIDACSEDGCNPATCGQTCPACACTLDRDRIAPQSVSVLVSLEPLDAAPPAGVTIPPVSFPQDILHVPKALPV